MKEKKTAKGPAGPLLDKPSILLPNTSPLSQFCFSALLLLLGTSGALSCFFTAFSIPVDPLPPAALAVLCSLLCAAQFLLPRKWGRGLALVMVAVWAVVLWYDFDTWSEAFRRTVNVVSEAYSQKLTFNLPVFLNLDFVFPDRERHLFTLLAGFTVFPLTWFLSLLLVRRRSTLGPFCLTGLVLLIPMSFSILPSAWALGLLLLFWAFLLLAAPALRQRRLLTEEHGCYQAAGVGFFRASTLALLPVLALCLLAVYRLCPPETYQRPQFAAKVREAVMETFSAPGFFKGGTGNGNSRVDLTSLSHQSQSDKTALRVKRQRRLGPAPATEYYSEGKEFLKSFVGSVYTGSSWERLPKEDAAQAASLLGSQKAQTLPASFTRFLPQGSYDIGGSYSLTVETTGTNPRCVYAPYTLSAMGEAPEGIRYVDDGFLESTRIFGLSNYSFFCDALPADDAALSYQERIMNYLQGKGSGTFPFSQFSGSSNIKEAVDLCKVSEDAKQKLSQSALSLTSAAEGYAPFVYEHYTQLPGELEKFLSESLPLLENGAILYGADDLYSSFTLASVQESAAASTAACIQAVRDLFQRDFTYSLNPPALPQGRDFVEYFLSESREGYCVHFATAAVAIFRAAGIPARYAEGYVVPSGENGAWVEVPERNAHAWAEVYFGGVGWVPVEVTPASSSAPAAYPNGRGPEAGTGPEPSLPPRPLRPEGQFLPSMLESSPSQAPSNASPSPVPGAAPGLAGTKEDAAWGPILALPLTLLLLILLAWGNRRFHLYRRKKAFTQPDRNKAALAAYAHILRLGKALVLLEDGADKPPEELENLALKARFSAHTLTEEELKAFTDHAAALEHRLSRLLPLPARLRDQYLLGLF